MAASTAASASAFVASAFSSLARARMAARSSAVKADDALPLAVLDFTVFFDVGMGSSLGRSSPTHIDSYPLILQVLLSNCGNPGEDPSCPGRGRRCCQGAVPRARLR